MITKRVRYSFIFLALILAACVPGELEPGSDGLPVTRQSSTTSTSTPTAEFAVDETATAAMSLTLVATSFPTPPKPPLLVTPTPTPYETLEPRLTTSTPAPPLPGFRYETAEGVWQVDEGFQLQLLVNRPNVVLSEDGSQAIYIEEGDIWLLNIGSGETRDITENSGRIHCCIQWWPARPDTVIFGSRPADEVELNSGSLSAVQTDGSGYTVLVAHQSSGLASPSPDGRQIAYGQGDAAGIYDWDTGVFTQLNPGDYGLENIRLIDSPDWSPDSRRLAWTVLLTEPGFGLAVAVFDLDTSSAELFHPYENMGRDGWFPAPAWHPDGDWLAFLAEEVDSERYGVWVLNTTSGEEQFIGRGMNPIWSPDGRWLYYTGFDTIINGPDTSPWLVEFDSWYHVNLWIPDGGRLLEWVLPG
jgi:hypothetical protein